MLRLHRRKYPFPLHFHRNRGRLVLGRQTQPEALESLFMPRAIHESNVAEPSFQFRGSADCLSLSRPVQRRGLAQAQPSSEVEVTDTQRRAIQKADRIDQAFFSDSHIR